MQIRNARWLGVTLAVAGVMMFGLRSVQASVYGALYEVANLTAATGNGSNTEAVLTYVPGQEGFIAITYNSAGESEWWTSDRYGITWTRSTVNPLDAYDCTEPGRHGIHTYEGSVYIGIGCAAGPTVFEVTGLESVELEHVTTTSNEARNYPAAAVVGGNLYMFYNGGYAEYNGTTWTDVEDATNQPDDAPLEASRQVDGQVYISFFSGVVAAFDGSSYEIIGDDYLEGVGTNDNNNLPAVEYFNNQVYVGNQDFDNGATIFKRDPSDTSADVSNWDAVSNLDSDNTIINKMLLSSSFGDDRYLVYFTTNATEGVNMWAMDEAETMTELVDAGLGGTNPEHNVEVISAIRRSIVDRGTSKDVMVFSTQNTEDETKIFLLVLGERFAFTPLARHTASTAEHTATLEAGRRYRVVVPASKVKVGDKYTLYVDGEVVDRVTAHSKRALTLRYRDAEDLATEDTFTVQVGRKMSYGRGDDQIVSRNRVLGNEVTVTVE